MTDRHLKLLVMHEDPRATLSLKRALESELDAEVAGAAHAEVALRRVAEVRRAAVLLHWGLPEGGAYELLWHLSEQSEPPPVLAFARHWPLDDARRAVLLGVSGFLSNPIQIPPLVADLEALRERGTTPSMARALAEHGDVLQVPDEALWAVEATGAWQLRMSDLANRVRQRLLATVAQRAQALAQRLEASAGEHLDSSMLKALCQVVQAGPEGLGETARVYGMDERLLMRLHRRAMEFGEVLGGTPPLLEAGRYLLEAARHREARSRSSSLAALQRAARVTLTREARGEPFDGPTPLVEELHRVFDLPTSFLQGIPASAVRRLGARLLLEETEAPALGHARRVLLAWLLRPGVEQPASGAELAALTALLQRTDEKTLVDALCVLNPRPSLRDLDLRALTRFAPKAVAPLREQVLRLLAHGRPGGLIDQRRMRTLVKATGGEDPVLVGPPTWKSVAAVLRGPPRPTTREAVERFLFAAGARGSGDSEVLATAMDQLVAAMRHGVDLPRFVQICRDALTGTLLSESIESLAAQPTADLGALIGPGALERQRDAQVADLLSEYAAPGDSAFELDPAVFAARLPKPRGADQLGAHGVLRLQVLASVLARQRDEGERLRILRAHVADARPRGEETLVLAAMAAELGDTHTPRLLQRQLGLEGGRPTPEVVRGALDAGRLDAAYVGVQALGSDLPETPGLLNEVGLALYEAGRGREAEPLLRRTLRLDGKRINVRFNLARLLHDLGREDEALPHALEVCRRSPHLSPAKALLGEVEAALLR